MDLTVGSENALHTRELVAGNGVVHGQIYCEDTVLRIMCIL
jgi:hypothetical protein